MSNVLDFSVNGVFPSKVGGTGTAVKYFPRPLGPSIGVAPLTPSATSAVGALFIPGGNVYNAQQINVLATGTFGNDTGDPSGTVLIKLYAVTGSLTAPTYTALAATATMTPSALGIVNNWAIDAILYGDGASGILGGSFSAYQNGQLSGSANQNSLATISGLDFNLGNSKLGQGAVLGLVVGVTFGTSDASNTASLYEFTIES